MIQKGDDCTKCMTVNQNKANALEIAACDGRNQQIFAYDGPVSQTIVSPALNMCVDAPNGIFTDGTPVRVWPCNGYPNAQMYDTNVFDRSSGAPWVSSVDSPPRASKAITLEGGQLLTVHDISVIKANDGVYYIYGTGRDPTPGSIGQLPMWSTSDLSKGVWKLIGYVLQGCRLLHRWTGRSTLCGRRTTVSSTASTIFTMRSATSVRTTRSLG